MLQVAAGGMILRAIGWTVQPVALTRPAIVGGMIVVAASMHVIEAVAVSGIVALQTGQPARRVWSNIVSFDVLDMVGQYALGIVGMIVAAAQPWALPLLLPLGVLLYCSSQRSIQLQAQSAAFAHQAFHDALTDLPNRTLFLDRLQQALRRAERAADGVGILFVDVDAFKAINDQFGHAAGDLVLQTVARRLDACVRPGDTVARLSGDEFVILLDLVPSVEAAHRVAERITASMREPIVVRHQRVQVTASIGIALSWAETTQAEVLLREADSALYQAKAHGKARYAVFDPHGTDTNTIVPR